MATSNGGSNEPIAIVGMGCRWPGGVSSPSQFWDFLRNKVNGWKHFDDPRFSAAGFHHPNADRLGSMSMEGAFLASEDARLFDHAFFGMTALEVETLDPSQRKLLEVVYEAIESSGDTWDSVSGTRTGVFVGNFCLDHWMIQSRDWDNPRPYAFTGAGTSILANRISYIFNLKGPSLTVDTACSSSMYALHLAMNALRAGDCDSAIVASANWIADPGVQIALDKLGALSASSRCHTFDARAEGYARGEGYGAIYLKRVPLAMADNSPIRAVIRGTAINSNGRTGGITRPSASGQEFVIKEAYRNAGGLPYSDTSYFEVHGTGTYVGDPIEVAAVGRVFGPERRSDDPLLVGSVKSNVGHGEGASALASIMKVVLALEKGAIPPVYDLQTRNPNIDFDGAKVVPVTELSPWPKNRLQRASINSFGYGGANGHAIIDHVNILLPGYVAPGIYNAKPELSNGILNGHTNGHTNGFSQNDNIAHMPITQKAKTIGTPGTATRQWVVLPLSAHNESSFKSNLEVLSQVGIKFPLSDIAYTLGVKRSKYTQRTFSLVERDEVSEGFAADRKLVRAPLQPANLSFVFTGQGAQWHCMGVELFEYDVFRKAIEFLDGVIQTLQNAPSWSLLAILSGKVDDQNIIQTAEVAQTVCTAVQVGLVDLLATWSIRPASVAGHSSGEIAGAYAAGRISAAEAIIAAYLRGQAVSKNQTEGAMLAVGLGPEAVFRYLEGHEDEVKIAAINSPGSATISGETAAIDTISKLMTADGVFNRKLKTGGNAYHSHHMIPIGSKYVQMLQDGFEHIRKLGLASPEQRYPQIPWVSSVMPSKSTAKFDDPASYWRANLQSPVLFSDAITGLLSDETAAITALLEIGPHPALRGPIEQIARAMDKTVAYASTLKRQEDGRISMLQCAGTLFTMNAIVDFAAVNAIDTTKGLEHGVLCHELPPYQYTYGGLNYHESRASKEYRYRSILRHDLLGSKVVGNAKLRPQWRNILRLKDVPWLGDHRLVPDPVLPGAAYIALAVEASLRIYNESTVPQKVRGYALRNVNIAKSLVIPEDDHGVELMTSLELLESGNASSPAWSTFSISSVDRQSNEWTEHSTGSIRIELDLEVGDRNDRIQAIPTATRAIDTKAWYKKFLSIGLGYGPVFQPLSDISMTPESKTALATVNLRPAEIKGGESRYALHPASLDGAIQLGLIACYGGRTSEAHTAFVPVQIPNLFMSSNVHEETCTVVAHGERRGLRGAYLDLKMLSSSGEVLLDTRGLRCISYSTEAKAVDTTFLSPYTRLVWRPDIRLMNNQQARKLYPPPEENVVKAPLWGITNKVAHFVVFSIYKMLQRMENPPKPASDIGHFFEWIQRKGQNDHSELMEEARAASSQGELLQKLDELVSQAPDVMEVKIAKLLHDNIGDILHEQRTGMDVIISAGLLTPLYQNGLLMTGIYPQLSEVLGGIAHSNPNLRILEVGGGTGGATRVAMKAFTGPNGIKAYKDYTFTDISAGFLSGARESLAEFRDMQFSVFNVEVDPMEQAYEASYDLVLACQVLHATSDMHRTLSNCRKLLRPGGRLVMVETNQNFIVPGVVVGTFTGYWAGIPDGRVDAPFQNLEAWEASLKQAGFSGLDLVLDDFPGPHNTTSVILSTYAGEERKPSEHDIVHILYSGPKPPPILERIGREFESRNIDVKLVTSVDVLVKDARVVALYDDDSLLSNASEQELKTFQQTVSVASSLVTLTSSGLVKGRAADGALISGLLRVLQNENPDRQFASIDVDAEHFDLDSEELQALAHAIVDVEISLQQESSLNIEDADPSDREFAWQDGSMWVSRHVSDTGFHSQHGFETRDIKPEHLPFNSQGGVRAAFETPGVLNSLYFTPTRDALQALPKDEIDVEIQAWGLSSTVVDIWSGRIDADYLSVEYAGIITAIGSDTTGFEVGDRVYGLGKGQFGNIARVPAAFASKLLPEDEFVLMASIPLAFTTAVYALEYVTRLQAGQSMLIEANTRDIGIACVMLARFKGADVYAIADTPEQASYFRTELGMPASHVLSSPSSKQLMHAAQGTRKGKFEVILSAFTEIDLLVKILAPLGCIVSLGPGGFPVDHSLPHMVTYSSIDIITVFDADPELGAELMRSVDRYRRQGVVTPIPGIVSPDPGNVSSTLMAIHQLPGKVVANFGNSLSLVRMAPSPPVARFDSEAWYVITGALGGLGRSIIPWMADHGARHLALLSRRNASEVPEVANLNAALASRGISVRSFVCDVSQADQVTDVIGKISSSRPIKGIVHAAVSYLDLSFEKISSTRWRKGLSAKVQGTRNLHKATLSMPLDFFVMITSALSLYAFATQGAYTAANNFQDAFARYRRRRGLPASTISFSLVGEVTDVGTDSSTMDLFARNKTLTHGESEFLTMLEPAFLNNNTATRDSAGIRWAGEAEDALSRANLHAYLDPRALAARRREEGEGAATLSPRWYRDGRASHMMRAFRDADQRSAELRGADDARGDSIAQLRAALLAGVREGAEARTATVLTVTRGIMQAVADMLYVEVEDIDAAKSVADMGVDSLIAAELRNWYLLALGARISMLDLLDPSISIGARATSIVDAALAERSVG